MLENNTAAIILAAGDGTRMKSAHPKVTCEVLFSPMIEWVLAAVTQAGVLPQNICTVVAAPDNAVCRLLPPEVKTAVQTVRLGTGHAVQAAADFIDQMLENGIEYLCVLCGDAPLIDKNDLCAALQHHRQTNAAVTVLTAVLPEGESYGRIVRQNGHIARIVEKKNADEATLAINEVNSGSYWFSTRFLAQALGKIEKNDVTGEFYLTDLVAYAVANGKTAAAHICQNPNSILGANTRKELAKLNNIAKNIVLSTHYDNGVDIPCQDGVIIAFGAKIGSDTTILPNCIITGNTVIEAGCIIGPNTTVHNCRIGAGSVIEQSKLTDSVVGQKVKIGPFSQLRPNSRVADHVKIGNFVEIKNSTLGEKTSVAHLTYIGDSDFGARINVGCGVVTVNYDGVGKYRSTVGDGAFIGCNSNLISPVEIGSGAYIAAASTVTEDVLPEALAIGRCRLVQKPNGAKKFRKPR